MLKAFWKRAKSNRMIHPQLGTDLRIEEAMPGAKPTDVHNPDCGSEMLTVTGIPPQARLTAPGQFADQHSGFLVRRGEGGIDLLFANVGEELPHIEIWKLAPGENVRFSERVPVTLDSAEATWVSSMVRSVACLPAGRIAIAVVYYAPQVTEGIYVYDSKSNVIRSLGITAPKQSDSDNYFEYRRVGNGAALLLYYSGRKRAAAERYYNEYNHVWLFSARHPDGVEILRIGIDDGNVADWMVIRDMLWLQTEDARDIGSRKRKIWSLDLSPML